MSNHQWVWYDANAYCHCGMQLLGIPIELREEAEELMADPNDHKSVLLSEALADLGKAVNDLELKIGRALGFEKFLRWLIKFFKRKG